MDAIDGSKSTTGIIIPMTSTPPIPRSAAVVAHPKMAETIAEAQAIATFLKGRGLESLAARLDDANLRKRVNSLEFDLLVAVGGDGTVLRSAHLCAPCGIPILGVNMGRLGFLMQIKRDEWHTSLEHLLKGEFWIENRMMLRTEHIRASQSLGSWYALNEAVVCRGATVRPVGLSASVDGNPLTNYIADGLIASTPTGSTAYALASGGPILPPELRNILLVPIAPHLSFDRAVVLSEGTAVSIQVTKGEAVLSVDGQAPIALVQEDLVDVRAGDYTAKFIRFGDAGYFYRNLTAHMNQNSITGVSS